MNVFLAPDLTPITGGTYFPPTDKYGQPGFSTILENIAFKVIIHIFFNFFFIARGQNKNENFFTVD